MSFINYKSFLKYYLKYKILILFFFSVVLLNSTPAQSYYPDIDTNALNPDYRNYINITEYNPALMPLDRQTSGTGVWIELNPKVPRVDYLGIHFVNKDTGWAVGAQGAIIYSTDGGEKWQNIISPLTNVLTNVHSFNGQEVLAVGYNGIIIRSDDCGITWQQIASGTTGDLWRVQMINDTLGWACGSNSFLIKTTDAGLTWNPIYTGFSNVVLQSLDFLDSNFGCIVGGNIDGGVLLKTTNAGQSWEEYNLGQYSLVSIEVFDTQRISTGGFTRIFSTLNGGDTWATTSVDGGVNTIAFADSLTGFAGLLQGSVWKTTNGGVNWQLAAGLMPACGKYWIMFPDDSTGFTAGTSLNLIKTTNKGLQWKSTVWNDDFNDVEFIDETKGFVISNKLYRTIDGGLSWNLADGAPRGRDILFLDSIIGFIGSDITSTLYKTTDSGNNWYITNRTGLTDTTGSINKIFFINQTTGWAVTSRGGIIKTIDKGENWVAQLNAGISNIVSGVHFIDSLYGWATIINSRPFKTTDGGNNWLQQTNLDIWASRDIYFANRDTGWIVDNTSWSALKKTTNEGINWITIQEIVNPFEFHFFPDPKHWMISGSPEKYITEDGGITWIDISNDVPSGFSSFCSVTDKLGYAVGGLGLILRYNDTSFVPVELIFFTSSVNANNITLNWQTATEINNQGFEIQRLNDSKIEKLQDWESVGFVSGNGSTTEPQFYYYVDKGLQVGKYQYRLKQIDFDGTFEYSNTIEVEINLLSKFSLEQNFPNPFNLGTTISWQSPIDGWQTIKLYNTLGEEVEILVNEYLEAGIHSKLYIANSALPS